MIECSALPLATGLQVAVRSASRVYSSRCMLPRPATKYHIHPALLLLSTPEKVAIPAESPERKGPQNTMAGDDNKRYHAASPHVSLLSVADIIPEILQPAMLPEAAVAQHHPSVTSQMPAEPYPLSQAITRPTTAAPTTRTPTQASAWTTRTSRAV